MLADRLENIGAFSLDNDLVVALRTISYEQAKRLDVIPLGLEAGRLRVATASTLDDEQIAAGLRGALANSSSASVREIEIVRRERKGADEALLAAYTIGAEGRAVVRLRSDLAIAYDALPLRLVLDHLEPELLMAVEEKTDNRGQIVTTPETAELIQERIAELQTAARIRLTFCTVPREVLRPAIRLAYRIDEAIRSRGTRRQRSAIRQTFEEIVEAAVSERAQNIYLEPRRSGGQIRFKIDGVVYHRGDLALDVYDRVTTAIWNNAVGTGSKDDPADGQIRQDVGMRPIDLRVSTLREDTLNGLQVSIRLHDPDLRPLSLGEAGCIGAAVRELELALAANRQGGIVIVGPSDAGKTVTAVAILMKQPLENMKVVGYAAPPELYVENLWQTAVTDRRPAEKIIASFVRMAVDGMLANEIREPGEARHVFDAIESGGFAVTSTHGSNVFTGIDKLIRMGISPDTLGRSTNAFVAQDLVRRLCAVCRVKDVRELPFSLGVSRYTHRTNDDGTVGCPACSWKGYSGRIGVFEVLRFNKAIRLAVGRYGSAMSSIELETLAGKYGYRPMVYDAYEKVAMGVTSLFEIERRLGTGADDSRAEDLR